MALAVKKLLANAGDIRHGFDPGLRKSPGGARGNPLQYSGLENPWTEEPSGLQSTGSQRIGHGRSNLACTQPETPNTGLAKKFIQFYTVLWGKQNKLLGQPNKIDKRKEQERKERGERREET